MTLSTTVITNFMVGLWVDRYFSDVSIELRGKIYDCFCTLYSLIHNKRTQSHVKKKRIDYYYDFEHLQVIEYGGEPKNDKVKNRVAYATYNRTDGKLWWMGKSYMQARNGKVNLETWIQDVRMEWGEKPSKAKNAPKNCKLWFEGNKIRAFDYRKMCCT